MSAASEPIASSIEPCELVLSPRAGDATRGVFAIGTNGEYSDAIAVNGWSTVIVPLDSFALFTRLRRPKAGWRITETSPAFLKAIQPILEPDEKLQRIISDGNLRFWQSDCGILNATHKRTFGDWIKDQFKGLLRRFLGAFVAFALLVVALIVLMTTGFGLLFIALGILFCLSIIGFVMVGDMSIRSIAIITNKRALLLDFKPFCRMRRVKSDQNLQYPANNKNKSEGVGAMDAGAAVAAIFSRFLPTLPKYFRLVNVTAVDYQAALKTETVAFERAVRLLFFFNSEQSKQMIQQFRNSTNKTQRKITENVIDHIEWLQNP